MNKTEQSTAERLVEVHQAPDEWIGNLLISYLQENGIEATFQGDSNVLVGIKQYVKDSDDSFGVYVLQHNAAQAQELIRDYMAAVTDPSVLEETAAKQLKVTAETITRLRSALMEERRTFALLGWIGVVFLGAGAALWMTWPSWLGMNTPPSGFRWFMVLLLTLGAIIAGKLTDK